MGTISYVHDLLVFGTERTHSDICISELSQTTHSLPVTVTVPSQVHVLTKENSSRQTSFYLRYWFFCLSTFFVSCKDIKYRIVLY